MPDCSSGRDLGFLSFCKGRLSMRVQCLCSVNVLGFTVLGVRIFKL